MLKLFLLLVIPLTVCKADVTWIGLNKPDMFDDNSSLRSSRNPTMKVFCEQTGGSQALVMHCFNLGQPLQVADSLGIQRTGSAGAVIYNSASCSFDDKNNELAYLLLDSCDDGSFTISVSRDKTGPKLEAFIPTTPKNVWMRCTTSSRKCQSFYSAKLSPTTWTPQQRPAQVASRSITTQSAPPPAKGTPTQKSSSQDGTPTLKSSSRNFKLTPRVAQVNVCEKGAYSCLSCSVGRVCVPTSSGSSYYEISRFSCTDLHPYCNYTSGVCSDSPDPACFDPPDREVGNFICMRDGFYPDVTSCSKYYICKNKVPYEHKCPDHPTPYYHPRLKYCVASDDFCVDKTSAPHCKTREHHGRKVPILFTKDYFLYCGTEDVLAVDRCLGAYFYDSVEQSCKFVCPYQGLFLSMDDCTKYIKCTPQPQGGFARTDLKCPDGKAFLESEYACVDRSMVPNCKAVHPDAYSK